MTDSAASDHIFQAHLTTRTRMPAILPSLPPASPPARLVRGLATSTLDFGRLVGDGSGRGAGPARVEQTTGERTSSRASLHLLRVAREHDSASGCGRTTRNTVNRV